MNRAELSACIAALRVVPRGQALRVVTASKYVYDGILKHLRRWRLQGRPFLNSDLWLQVQAEVDARVAPTLWRHVYSHIGVAGNERADGSQPGPAGTPPTAPVPTGPGGGSGLAISGGPHGVSSAVASVLVLH